MNGKKLLFLMIGLMLVTLVVAVPTDAGAQQDPWFPLTFNFGYPHVIGGGGSAWGDFNNDGYLDLAIQGFTDYVRLYRNQGNRTFTEHVRFTSGSTAGYYGLAWGDHDNDGDLDLAVGSFSGQNYLYINNGDGTFTQSPQFGGEATTDVEWGNYDNDGDLDLAVANNIAQNYLYINNGDGTFTASPRFGSMSKNIAWGDYDNDGDLDLAVASTSSSTTSRPNYLYINNGNGTFTSSQQFNVEGVFLHSMSLAWGDYDNDEDLDLALGNINPYYNGPANPQNYLFTNNGNRMFTPSPQFGTYGYNVAWGDFDDDGDLDLAVGGRSCFDQNCLYINNGDGTFMASPQFGRDGWNVDWVDYDNDGDLDILVRDDLYTNPDETYLPIILCN